MLREGEETLYKEKRVERNFGILYQCKTFAKGILWFIYLIFLFLPPLPVLAFVGALLGDRSILANKMRDVYTIIFSRSICEVLGLRISVQLPYRSDMNLGHGKLLLFLHGSNLDTIVLPAILPIKIFSPSSLLVPIAKRSLKYAPILHVYFAFIRPMWIVRTRKSEAIRSLNNSIEVINSQCNLCIAPEGKRRRNPSTGPDHILPFKKGPFHVLLQSQSKSFIPAFCIGANSAWKPGNILPNPESKITAIIGPEIYLQKNSESNEKMKPEDVRGKWHVPNDWRDQSNKTTENNKIKIDDSVNDYKVISDDVTRIGEQCRSVFEEFVKEVAVNEEGKYSTDYAFKNGVPTDDFRRSLFYVVPQSLLMYYILFYGGSYIIIMYIALVLLCPMIPDRKGV